MMTYGETIKRARERAGKSQEELAETLGVSRQAVSKWESNLSRPTPAKLAALTAYLELPEDLWERLDREAQTAEEAALRSQRETAAMHAAKRWKRTSAVLAALLCVSLLGNFWVAVKNTKSQKASASNTTDLAEIFPETLTIESITRSYAFGDMPAEGGDPALEPQLARLCRESPESVLWQGCFDGTDRLPAVHLAVLRCNPLKEQGVTFWDVYLLYAVPDEAGDLNWKILDLLGAQNVYVGGAHGGTGLQVEAFTEVQGQDGFKCSLSIGAGATANTYIVRREDGIPCVMAALGGSGSGTMECDVDEDGQKEIICPGGLPEYWTIYDQADGHDWADVYTLSVEDCGVSNLSFDPEKGGFVVEDAQGEVLVRYLLKEGTMTRAAATDVTPEDYPDVVETTLVFDETYFGDDSAGDPDAVQTTTDGTRITPRQQAYLALEQLYDLTGQRFDQLYCAVSSGGSTCFSLEEGGLSDRFFYAADLPERLGGEAGGIPSVYFAWQEAGNDWSPLSFRDLTLREDWRSASNPGTLRWYYQRLTLMQQGEAAYENDEGLWLTDGSCYTGDFLETEDGRALTNFTGPYPDGEIHH